MRIPSASLLVVCALVLAACSGERAVPPRRDLTLLDPADQSATPAVVSARELAVTRAEPGATVMAPARRRSVPAPVRTGARQAHLAAQNSAPAPAPVQDADPATESEDATARDGHALAPGQQASVIPATSASGPAPVPDAGYFGEGGRRRGRLIVDGDRCIPGRGEVIPQAGPEGVVTF
jgi:hypothetical protein